MLAIPMMPMAMMSILMTPILMTLTIRVRLMPIPARQGAHPG